jgi:hypothetical protein
MGSGKCHRRALTSSDPLFGPLQSWRLRVRAHAEAIRFNIAARGITS